MLGGRRLWQARKPPPSMGQVGGGMNRNCSIFYAVGSSSCTLPFLWGMLFPQAWTEHLGGVRSWMKGDAKGRARRVQCTRGALDSVSGFSRSQSEVWTRSYLFL
jgi:hypothetical protein